MKRLTFGHQQETGDMMRLREPPGSVDDSLFGAQ